MTTIPELLATMSQSPVASEYVFTSEHASWTSLDFIDNTSRAAKSFARLGLVPRYQCATTFAWNAPENVAFQFGAILAGSTSSAIYFTSSESACLHAIRETNSKIVFVDTLERYETIRRATTTIKLKAIVTLGDLGIRARGVYTWDQFLRLGEGISDSAFRERIEFQKPDDPCMYVYTSGSTGACKIVTLTHANLTWTAARHIEQNPFMAREPMRVASIFSMSHIAPIMFDVLVPMTCVAEHGSSATVHFPCEGHDILESIRITRPTVIFATPRVWQKVADEAEKTALNPLFARALERYHHRRQAHVTRDKKPLFTRPALRAAKLRVLRRMGLDTAKLCFMGGAPIVQETVRRLSRVGVDVIGAYGMSELSGSQCYSRPNLFIDGFAGLPVPGTEAMVTSDGELCFRGPQVMHGYLGDDEPHVDEDGWFHTGDLGSIDPSTGLVKVTGRIKDLIITTPGAKICPVPVENFIAKECPAITNVVLVGDGRKYLGLLVTLTRDGTEAQVLEAIEAYNTRVSECRATMINAHRILPHDFTVATGELTATGKTRRAFVLDKFKAEIDDMYA